MIKTLAISTPDAEKPVGQLSGGNQQKVSSARSLVSGPRVLILDEPTRGIDVGAHAEIVALIRKLCGDGLALLVASSELDELVAVSDRVAVLRDRHKIGEISGADITRDNIIHMIAAAAVMTQTSHRDRYVKRSSLAATCAPSPPTGGVAAVGAGADLPQSTSLISPEFFSIRVVEGRLFGSV